MKKNSTNIKRRIILLIFATLVLINIRIFQNELFYDPFISFFKSNFHNYKIPDYDIFKLTLSLFFRYALNSLITVWILYLLFESTSIIKFASILLVVFFIILIFLFFLLMNSALKPNYIILFYIRRFLIQPIFLLLFIPGFYYQITKK